MEEKNLSEQESLQIIQQMINTAKQEQKDDGVGWIIWGWLLFTVSVFSAINETVNWVDQYFFWDAFGIITALLFGYMLIKNFFFRRQEKVKTYTKDIFQKLNVGFFISLMFIIFSINVDTAHNPAINPLKGFALLINLYAFWILIYGTALNFKPSVIAAFIVWALGFAALFVPTFQYVMLLHTAAALVGYIIPGHIANREFKKLSGKGNTSPGV